MSVVVTVSARFGIPLIAACLALAGCGGDSSDPASTSTATTNQGVGTTGSGGSTGDGAASTTSGSDPCVRIAPANELITEFSDWAGNSWGSGDNLTGDSFQYTGDNTEEFAYSVDDTAENLHITGVVNDYAGFGMSFGSCTDADTAGYSGIQFDIMGDVGSDGGAVFQVQTSEDQNIDYDQRGACDAAVTECANPQAAVEGISADDFTTVQFAWADFTGGQPTETLSPDQILGLQWQFECTTDAMCAVDIRIDNVMFY